MARTREPEKWVGSQCLDCGERIFSLGATAYWSVQDWRRDHVCPVQEETE